MIIGWFSGGATSAVAIKLVIDAGYEVMPIYFETGSHHPDHQRFLKDCEDWYKLKIITRQNPKYTDVIDVIRKTKFINSAYGARCTLELKKNLRYEIEKEYPNYSHEIFGFEYGKKEINRAIRFQEQYPSAKAVFPLIEKKMDKQQCFNILKKAGIEIPAMYKLGYNNSNCNMCVKGGMGYWNKIRKDFPDNFSRMAKVEREIGRSCIKGMYLDELSPIAGRHEDISLGDCGVVCAVELDGLEVVDDVSRLNKLWV